MKKMIKNKKKITVKFKVACDSSQQQICHLMWERPLRNNEIKSTSDLQKSPFYNKVFPTSYQSVNPGKMSFFENQTITCWIVKV